MRRQKPMRHLPGTAATHRRRATRATHAFGAALPRLVSESYFLLFTSSVQGLEKALGQMNAAAEAGALSSQDGELTYFPISAGLTSA